MKFLTERDGAEIALLEERLLRFYNTSTDYPAFQETALYPRLWEEVIARAREIPASPCRILEVGAGRSGFGAFLRARSGEAGPVHLTSQDITRTNAEHLRETADEVLTDDVARCPGEWDVIFHSYVYEHICRPAAFIRALWDRLRPGGFLLLQGPRYDFPFYLPPSLDHLGGAARFGTALRLLALDAADTLRAAPAFRIVSDPAVFHLPFRRDRDAVHRVRRADLRKLLPDAATFSDFPLPGSGWKDRIVKRFLTLRVAIGKAR